MLQKGLSLFGLPVFQGPAGSVTAEERQKLPDKQACRRWDYFIRTSRGDIESFCSNDLAAAQRRLREAEDARGQALTPFWICLVVGALAGFIGIIALSAQAAAGLVGCLLGVILLGVALAKLLPKVMERSQAVSAARDEVKRIREIIDDLARQIPTDIPTDQEMRAFVTDRLKTLEQRARANLRLDSGEVTVEAEIPPIYEWGGLQDEQKPGYEAISREFPLHHKLVRATEDGRPIYATYYVQYLFPTRDYIAVHGEFVDIISDVTKGRLTDEYYYSDVTSVRTEMRERQLFFLDNRHEECTTLRLTVASGDAVEVSMFDQTLQRTLNQYVEDQRKARAEVFESLQRKLSEASGDEQAAIREEIEKAKAARVRLQEEDRASVANQVVRDIRHQLRTRKGHQVAE